MCDGAVDGIQPVEPPMMTSDIATLVALIFACGVVLPWLLWKGLNRLFGLAPTSKRTAALLSGSPTRAKASRLRRTRETVEPDESSIFTPFSFDTSYSGSDGDSDSDSDGDSDNDSCSDSSSDSCSSDDATSSDDGGSSSDE
jgi:hypothetical protein